MPSIWRRTIQALRSRMDRLESPETHDLRMLGLMAHTSMQSFGRLELGSGYGAAMNEAIKNNDPAKAVQILVQTIREVAAPFYGARDQPMLAKMLALWETYVGMFFMLYDNAVADEKPEAVQEINKLAMTFAAINIIPKGQEILALSWSEKHTTPNFVAVVKAQGQPESGMVFPRSEVRGGE